jgi:hypothetical protein
MDYAVANTECTMCSTTGLQVHSCCGVSGSVSVFYMYKLCRQVHWRVFLLHMPCLRCTRVYLLLLQQGSGMLHHSRSLLTAVEFPVKDNNSSKP